MIEILYKDIFSIIFHYLESKDKANFRLVCKVFDFYFCLFIKTLTIRIDKPNIEIIEAGLIQLDSLKKFSNLESIVIESCFYLNLKLVGIPKENKIKTLRLFGNSILIPKVEYEKLKHIEKYENDNGSTNDFSCLKYFPKLSNFKFYFLKEINQKDLDYFLNLKSFDEIFHQDVEIFSKFIFHIKQGDNIFQYLDSLYKDYFSKKIILKKRDENSYDHTLCSIGDYENSDSLVKNLNEINMKFKDSGLSFVDLNIATNLKSITFPKQKWLFFPWDKFSKNFFNISTVEIISQKLEKLVLPKLDLLKEKEFQIFFNLLIKFKNLEKLDISRLRISRFQKIPLFFDNFQKLSSLKTRTFYFHENDSLKNLKNLKSLKILLCDDNDNCPISFIKEDLLSLQKFSIRWINFNYSNSEIFNLETKTLNFMKNLLKLKIKSFISRKDNDDILNLPFLKSFYCSSFFKLNQKDFLNFKYLIDLTIDIKYKYDQSFEYLFENNHLEEYLRMLVIRTQLDDLNSFQDLILKFENFKNLRLKILKSEKIGGMIFEKKFSF